MHLEFTFFKKNGIIFSIALLCLLLFSPFAQAHILDNELAKVSTTTAAWTYLKLGFIHILPLGYDHILFILGIFLLNNKLKPLLWQATAFTIAHSITLGLSIYGFITANSSIVEPIIAVSIVFVALENIFSNEVNRWRILVIFIFGLMHGLGFAGALIGLGLPKNQFLTGLISFNVGVELGQVAVILIAYFAFGKWCNQKPWYRKRIVIPASITIGIIASYWTIERIFL